MKNNLANFSLRLGSSTLFVLVISLAAISLKAQILLQHLHITDQAELSKVEEWVLSQGAEESIAPELALYSELGMTGSQ